MNKKIKLILSLLVTLLVMVLFNTKVHAASASISASDSNVIKGSEVKITTTINAAAWNLHLTGAVSADYAENTHDAENTTKVETTTFKPNSAGSYTIYLSGDVTGSEDTFSTHVSGQVTINVTEAQTNESSEDNNNTYTTTEPNTTSQPTTTTTVEKSNNANLKNLGITPNDFKGFKPGTISYDVKVPNNVEKVTVYATASDSKATISGTGAKNLNVGKNSLAVTVTAEDGTKKTYTINVTREEAEVVNDSENENLEEQTNNNEINAEATEIETPTSDLIKLEITGFTLTPTFSPDIYEYNLKVDEEITDLNVVTQGANDNINIEVAGNTSLQDGENVVTILVYNKETNKTTTYQVIVEKTNAELETASYNASIQKAKRIKRILLGVIAVIVICIVIFIVVKQKRQRFNSTENQYEYDEDDLDRINLDDEEELFNRVNKTKFEKLSIEKSDDTENFENNIEQSENNELENKIEDEEVDTEQYFRTTKSKRRGKHF